MIMQIFVREKQFYRNVLAVGGPIAAQSLITVGVNMMDNIMLGRLGEYQMSGATLANQFINIFHICCMGLGMGADDYVTKPFSPLELGARVKSQLRRYHELNPGGQKFKDHSGCISIHGINIDKENHMVVVEDKEVKLTPIEFDILYLLASNPGKVFSTDEIFEKVWNEKVYEANNTVMVHIRRLRSKLKEDQRKDKIISTVWGVGYKIEK